MPKKGNSTSNANISLLQSIAQGSTTHLPLLKSKKCDTNWKQGENRRILGAPRQNLNCLMMQGGFKRSRIQEVSHTNASFNY